MVLSGSLTFTAFLNSVETNAVTWSSSNTNVATVADGVITPLTTGSTIIKATSTADTSVTASCTLTVSDGKVVSITVAPATTEINPSGTATFTATVLPTAATTKTVTWSSSDTGVATIDSSTGVATGVAVGSTTITASATDGSGVTGTATLNVSNVSSTTYKLVTSTSELVIGRKIAIVATQYDYAIGSQNSSSYRNRQAITKSGTGTSQQFETVSGVATLLLEQSTYDTSKYSFHCTDSSDSGYLAAQSSSSNYMLTNSAVDGYSSFSIAIDSSSYVATITASSGTKNLISYNNSATRFSCYSTAQNTIQLYQVGGSSTVAVTGVSLDKATAKTSLEDSVALLATVAPSNATNKAVTWSSDTTGVATVDSNGNVNPIAAGSAIITVTTDDGGYTATCTVTIVDAAGAARTWASTFLSTTATECSNKNVLETTWTTLEGSYNDLYSLAKDYFYNNANNADEPNIYAAAKRYLVIVEKYNYDPFVVNGNGDVYSDNYQNLIYVDGETTLDKDYTVVTIILLSVVTFSLSFAGFYFINKKNKAKAK